jgi:hypothetical protein
LRTGERAVEGRKSWNLLVFCTISTRNFPVWHRAHFTGSLCPGFAFRRLPRRIRRRSVEKLLGRRCSRNLDAMGKNEAERRDLNTARSLVRRSRNNPRNGEKRTKSRRSEKSTGDSTSAGGAGLCRMREVVVIEGLDLCGTSSESAVRGTIAKTSQKRTTSLPKTVEYAFLHLRWVRRRQRNVDCVPDYRYVMIRRWKLLLGRAVKTSS